MPAMIALVPINDRAHEALRLPRNRYSLSDQNSHQVFDLRRIRSADSSTLATLGRNGDIVLQGSDISNTQCSIKINLEANVVIFCDESRNCSSKVYGHDAPIECGRPRKIVLCQGINYIIGIGDENDPYQFELIWYQNSSQTTIGAAEEQGFVLEEYPHLAETIDESETALVSQSETQFHTAGAQQLPDLLGSGTYGDIFKGIDPDHGRLIAAQEGIHIYKPNVELHREVAAQGFTNNFPADDPVAADADPVFANPVFINPILAGPVPADTILADPVSVDFKVVPVMHQAACQAIPQQETGRPAVTYQTAATPQPQTGDLEGIQYGKHYEGWLQNRTEQTLVFRRGRF
ncbi:hypothetical protein F4680DRAFT_442247 [Xylaria scruposa]|nr:hypothetical protein F4680DRAFT_442247 [Xylaria scruposa]